MIEQLRKATATVLDLNQPAHTLRPEVIEITTVLASSQAVWASSQQDISSGETQTSNGLAISPTMAAMCAEDYVRTIAFIRGLHAAIVDVRNQLPERPVRVLYAGCGPYATLAVPLMTLFSAAELTFTLLDIHPESIKSAESIADTLCLSDSVERFETVDAGSYRVNPDQAPDIILVEVMQACLEAEPQVAITRHLLSQAPNAILIPEEVRIEVQLVDPAKEFELDGLPPEGKPLQRDRIAVGPVFVVNRESVNLWKPISGNRLPGLAVQIPESVGQQYQPMLFTKICTYQKHILQDYDSGLTCPKTLSTERAIKPGDTIQFHYELGAHPRLRSQ